MGHKERKKKNEKEEEATAEKDKADDEESQYSYITEDEDKELAAEPPARPAGRTVTMTASKAKARPRSHSSSSDRGLRARELRSPFSPPREEGRTWKAAAVKAERPSSPTRTARGRSVAPVMPPPHTVPASDPPRRRKSREGDPLEAHGAKPERETERDAAGGAEDKWHNDPHEGKGHGKGNPYRGHHGDYDDEDAQRGKQRLAERRACTMEAVVCAVPVLQAARRRNPGFLWLESTYVVERALPSTSALVSRRVLLAGRRATCRCREST